MIGEALVPYYRQILPIFNMFKNKRRKNIIIQSILVIRLITDNGKMKTCLSSFKKPSKFWRNTVERMPI